jgi:uncharacterized membrane protein
VTGEIRSGLSVLRRWWRHLTTGTWAVRRRFDNAGLRSIEDAIRDSERGHSGEIRFAVEAALTPGELARGLRPRDRAWQVFSEHRLWDTEHNNGVLIYLLWADRAVEILADRGALRRVDPMVWTTACAGLSRALQRGDGVAGVTDAVAIIGEALSRVEPVVARDQADPDELPNAPIVLR